MQTYASYVCACIHMLSSKFIIQVDDRRCINKFNCIDECIAGRVGIKEYSSLNSQQSTYFCCSWATHTTHKHSRIKGLSCTTPLLYATTEFILAFFQFGNFMCPHHLQPSVFPVHPFIYTSINWLCTTFTLSNSKVLKQWHFYNSKSPFKWQKALQFNIENLFAYGHILQHTCLNNTFTTTHHRLIL